MAAQTASQDAGPHLGIPLTELSNTVDTTITTNVMMASNASDAEASSSAHSSSASSTNTTMSSRAQSVPNTSPTAATAPSQRPTPASQRRFKHAFSSWWWWEVGAALLSITCLVLIVVTLATMNNKPLTDWKLAISINAAVSILATVGRSALMLLVASTISQLMWFHFESKQCLKDVQKFDEASRGPWGAAMLVLGERGGTLLASITALVAVLSLGFEPAAQQMLSFSSRNALVASSSVSAYVGQAVGFNRAENLVANPFDVFVFGPARSLQTALVNSLSGVVANASSRCPTSTCHFPRMSTLAVCERCRDATGTVQHSGNVTNSSTSVGEWWDYYTVEDSFYKAAVIHSQFRGAIPCNYDTAVNATFAGAGIDLDSRRAGFLAAERIENIPNTTFVPRQCHVKTRATICDFSWCMRTYSSSDIVGGVLTSHEESRHELEAVSGDPGLGGFDGYTELRVPGESSIPSFTVDHFMDAGLWTYVAGMLTGLASSNNLLGVASERSFNATAALMADAMTNWLRGPENNGSVLFTGEAMDTVTYVHVRWPWLLWPAILTVVGTIMLFICIIRNQSRSTLFKSSALALLFHGLHGFEESDIQIPSSRRVENADVLEDVAEGLKAAFAKTESGELRFMKQ